MFADAVIHLFIMIGMTSAIVGACAVGDWLLPRSKWFQHFVGYDPNEDDERGNDKWDEAV